MSEQIKTLAKPSQYLIEDDDVVLPIKDLEGVTTQEQLAERVREARESGRLKRIRPWTFMR